MIAGSTSNALWAGADLTSDQLPEWQQDVLAKILALTIDQEIHYLSTAMPAADDWEIIAFTEATVVRVALVRSAGKPEGTETISFARSSLDSLEVVGVSPLPAGEEGWPAGLNLIGHYASGTVNLPLDKFASPDNSRDLARLLASLLQDVGH